MRGTTIVSLRALGIGPGDAVLVPSLTFFATAGTVHNVGATPVFCDIDPKTYNIDPASSRAAIKARGTWHMTRRATPSSDKASAPSPHATGHKLQTSPVPQATGRLRIRAIIPVHLYGQMADMDEIMQLADEFDLAVIEDAAQAIGARYFGAQFREPNELHEPSSRAGTMGSVGCFSFYPTKNLGAYGDAGMVTTDDDAVAESIRLLRVHGAKPKYFHRKVGINSRLDAIQAAILDVKLRHLDDWSDARRRVADRYDRLLAGV